MAKLTAIGVFNPVNRLSLAISIPPRNQVGLSTLLQDLYDPTSPKYHRYLTPAQYAEQFGPTPEDYQALIAFFKTNGLSVTATHPNRLVLDVEGAVSDIQRLLHVTLRIYQHPTEGRGFYSPDTAPTIDAPVKISGINGLDNYSTPHSNLHIKNGAVPFKKAPTPGARAGATPNAGTGPFLSGQYTYGGSDFRNAYFPGTTINGSGQSIALLEFDGYYSNDISNYQMEFGLATPSITVVSVDGGNPIPNTGNGEVALDIEMVMAMAPAAGIYVYEAPPSSGWIDILSKIANDDSCSQISSSWTENTATMIPGADAIFQQMAAQGQSFFNASGDKDAYTVASAVVFPSDNPYITVVGGTTLTTGSGASYSAEAVWNSAPSGSGGGYSSSYPIPLWQQNVNMATNQGSTIYRNLPDVALVADNVFSTLDNGFETVSSGTSCAAPLWAAFTALVNENNANNSSSKVGFLNPALYSIGKNAPSAYHDITSGNNYPTGTSTEFSAVAGYDLCTGWGTPTNALLTALGTFSGGVGTGYPWKVVTTSPNMASGSRTGAANTSAPQYYYKGADNNLWAVYFNGTAWTQKVLTTTPNLSDWVTFHPSYGYVYYQGSDQNIWTVYFDGTQWQQAQQTTIGNVAGDIVADTVWGFLYYRGTDGNVWADYYNGSAWTQEALTTTPNAASSLSVDSTLHFIYYRSADNNMWVCYWNGTSWITQKLSTTANVGGAVSADQNHLVYYRSSTDSTPWATYFDGSIWSQKNLVATSVMGSGISSLPVSDESSTSLFSQYYLRYINANNQVETLYFDGSIWHSASLGDNVFNLTGGLSYDSSDNFVFSRRSDGNVVVIYP